MVMLMTEPTEHATPESEIERLQQSYNWLTDSLAFTGHELRNGLMRLKLMTAKLERSLHLSEEEEVTIKRISQSTRMLEHIALNCLRLAQVDSANFAPNLGYVDLAGGLLEPLLADYTDSFLLHSLTVELDLPSKLDLIHADRDLMWLVLSNLIGNAVKYGEPEGTIRIGISQNDEVTEISLWNTGMGISATLIDRVFDRYVTGEHQGIHSTGVGLYLVKRIIDAHGGVVHCESVPKEWVRFVIQLPNQSANLQSH